MEGILGVVIPEEGVITTKGLGIIEGGRQIAEILKVPVDFLVLGNIQQQALDLLLHVGARKVYTISGTNLLEYHDDIFLEALYQAVLKICPSVIFLLGDLKGMELAPRLSVKLNAGLVSDVVGLKPEGNEVRYVRPVFGGNALAEMKVNTSQSVILFRPQSFEPKYSECTGTSSLIQIPVSVPITSKKKVIEKREEKGEGVKLEEAKIVVAGGRGIGGPEGFEELGRFAKIMHASLGASRAAVDAGWVPASWQVGQTGKIIAPDLYFAIGISGASQHLAGITGAKTVVAINTDPDAPIFKVATYGIVGDYRKIIPALCEKFPQSTQM